LADGAETAWKNCYDGVPMARLYLDHHATTPVDPRVMEAMRPWFTEKFGNAASRVHDFGKEAGRAVEAARSRVADLIGADPAELVFTSGATESDNLAVKGALEQRRPERDALLVSAIEHPAVLDPAKRLGALVLPVGSDGVLDVDVVRKALSDRVALVSVMLANNEIGTIQDVAAIGAACRERGAWFHTDAAQAAGTIPIDVDAMNVDLLSLTAHKMYGPKGVGALYVRKRNPRVKLVPQMEGGGHEGGLRSGTLPVPLIVGFGEACAIAKREMAGESKRVLALRERLRARIFERIPEVRLNGSLERRLAGNLNVVIRHAEGESLILAMQEVALSTGSACASLKLEPSHVLKAIGLDEPDARSSLRFGLGRFTTEAEVDRAAELLEGAAAKLRAISPLWPPDRGISAEKPRVIR
jgi:cysteine desulfurase